MLTVTQHWTNLGNPCCSVTILTPEHLAVLFTATQDIAAGIPDSREVRLMLREPEPLDDDLMTQAERQHESAMRDMDARARDECDPDGDAQNGFDLENYYAALDRTESNRRLFLGGRA